MFGVSSDVVGFKFSGKRARMDQGPNWFSVYVDKPFSQNVYVRSVEELANLQCAVDDCAVVGREFSEPQMKMRLKSLLIRSKSSPPFNRSTHFDRFRRTSYIEGEIHCREVSAERLCETFVAGRDRLFRRRALVTSDSHQNVVRNDIRQRKNQNYQRNFAHVLRSERNL